MQFFYLTLIFSFLFTLNAEAYIGLAPIITLLTGLGWVFGFIIVTVIGIIIYPIWILLKKKKFKKKNKIEKN